MAKNTGKNFENEIRKSLKGADCWWFRIQDTNDVSKFVKQAIMVVAGLYLHTKLKWDSYVREQEERR